MYVPVQIASVLSVLPSWLPTAAICTGICLLLFGITNRYIELGRGPAGRSASYGGYPMILSITLCVAGATYVTLLQNDLVLLFVITVFFSGRIIQGAITARIIQKIMDVVAEVRARARGSQSGFQTASVRSRVVSYVIQKLKDRLTIMIASSTIAGYTALSVLAVFILDDGTVETAIRRFWVGYFLLVVAGLVFDFRYFSHRLPWVGNIGVILAVTGAFMYDPISFSAYIAELGPYIQTPIPDWSRYPISAIGFLFGVLFWGIFYRQVDTSEDVN